MRKIVMVFSFVSAMVMIAVFFGQAWAAVSGPCANCHTMHNSQEGDSMAFDGSSGPYPALTRGTCLGCHGQNTASNMVNGIPQVYHTDATDLAAGNFRYIVTGGDAKGHNVVAIDGVDATLTQPPGQQFHGLTDLRDGFACSDYYGCHGMRYSEGTMSGSHHRNVDGQCNVADEVYNSYRFLYSVKGFENMGANKYQNLDANNHNEYYGVADPGEYGCTDCHVIAEHMTIRAPNNSISGFCATCHRDFHMLSQIGGDVSGPFTRHPSDIVLPASGEYAGYTAYSVEAPVARTSVVSSMGSTVTPGTDVVMCLSCHMAHASPYDDMLRWDYDGMVAGGGGDDGAGCFTCHTQKDGS